MHSDLIIDLKNTIEEGYWNQVISALRQDALIWDALQDPVFRKDALEKLGNHPEYWSPANLFFLKLGYAPNTTIEQLKSETIETAENTYQKLRSMENAQYDLLQAGLLALALINHSDDWSILPLTTPWSTAFACLYAWLPKKSTLLSALPLPQAIQVILANPLRHSDQLDILKALIKIGSPGKQGSILKLVQAQRSGLALALAAEFINHKNNYRPETLHQYLADSHFDAENLALTNDFSSALVSYDEVIETATQIKINAVLGAAQMDIKSGHPDQALVRWQEHAAASFQAQNAQLALAFMEYGYYEHADELLSVSHHDNHLITQVAIARWKAHNGDHQAARQILMRYLHADDSPNNSIQDHWHHLLTALIEVGLYGEVIRFAPFYLKNHPNDIQTIQALSQSQQIAGTMNDALPNAQLVVSLQPQDNNLRRTLAEGLETNGLWDDAFAERETIIRNKIEPSPSDFYELANCALQSGKAQQAIDISQQALLYNPEDGLAHTISGKALLMLDQRQQAHHLFEQAIQTSPELPDPWLALAQDQLQSDESSKALQTLKSAARAVPNSSRIHFSLGKTYQIQNESTKALNAFRRASDLIRPSHGNSVQATQNAQIYHALGTALKDLGHNPEALQAHENAYNAMPAQAFIAHAYGKMLIEHGQAEEALSPLTLAKNNDPENSEIYIDYAKAHLIDGKQLQEAENALKNLLVFDSNHFQAKTLLAEALEANGKTASALDAYNLALISEDDQNAEYHQRLILGKGRVALVLDQAETALVALEEAQELSPQDLSISKLLAEAYKLNHLPQKALRIAKATLTQKPFDIDMLLWYTKLMSALGFSSNAINALDHAITKQPHRAELYLLHGQLQLENNEHISAQHSFSKLATLEIAAPDHLKKAADGLLASQDPASAVTCLERAIEFNKIHQESSDDLDTDSQFNIELLTQLAHTYTILGTYQLAIDTIDKTLELNPTQGHLMHQKGSLLCKLGDYQSAFEWNNSSREKMPKNLDLDLQAAEIQRFLGNLPAALEIANKVHRFAEQSQYQHFSLAAVTMIAELNIAMMNNDHARQLLAQHTDIDPSADIDTATNFYCILGELSIQNSEKEAGNALLKALALDDQNPRVLALQARIKRNQGDVLSGEAILETALELLARDNKKSVFANDTYTALAIASLEFQSWSKAILLLEDASEIAPKEPLAYTLLAEALVQRAEYQNLFSTLNITCHAPGDLALSRESYQNYDHAVLSASRLIDAMQLTDIQPILSTYLVRGEAVFHPSVEHAEALLDFSPTADNMAAYIATLRSSGNSNKAAEAALELYQHEDTPNSPFLFAQIALALIRKAPNFASSAAQKAVDESRPSNNPNHPLFIALQAYVAHRIEDHKTHLEAVQAMLEYWNDEPDWHALAAESLIKQRDMLGKDALEQAKNHLQESVKLVPSDGCYLLKLGKVFLSQNDSTNAIKTLQKAVQLDPDSVNSRLALAKAVQFSGNNHQAKQIINEIAQIAAEEPEAYLLLAKIALEEKQTESALQYTRKILQTNPHHHEALLTKAEALTKLEKFDKALSAFELALPQTDQNANLLIKHANLTQKALGTQAALKILQNYHKQYPNDTPVQIRLGVAFADNGNKEAAIKLAQKTLQKKELLTVEQHAQTLKLLGMLLRQSGQLDQAIAQLNNAVDHNPDWAEPHIELGRTFQQRRQYDRALSAYQQAISLDPFNPQPYHRAGIVLKESKDYVNSEIMLRKAANLAPKDLGIQRKLAAMIALNLVHHTQTINTPTTTR
ncbi:MAG: tetratricopeptide repeat protein [Chloroflexi bacterium]|nr:tetratricopeptide repeat protein [Chloroflexota bacterium]